MIFHKNSGIKGEMARKCKMTCPEGSVMDLMFKHDTTEIYLKNLDGTNYKNADYGRRTSGIESCEDEIKFALKLSKPDSIVFKDLNYLKKIPESFTVSFWINLISTHQAGVKNIFS